MRILMKAKKSLGQNFLKNEDILTSIADVASITSQDTIIEIGPGTGLLTQVLADRAKKVIAFELDQDLIPYLLKKFPLSSNVSVYHKDILSLKHDEKLIHEVFSGTYKVVANIPYYITAPIIQFLLELPVQATSITLMVQKEVAERITASVGDMSILAISVQYYATPKYIKTVSREFFDPIPQVDSAILQLTPKKAFSTQDSRFFSLVKSGFSSRRKTLINNISSQQGIAKNDLAEIFTALSLPLDIRAQALSLELWEQLLEEITLYKKKS